MQQSVRGYSAAMLAGNDSDMQGIHPVMYLLWEYNQKVTDFDHWEGPLLELQIMPTDFFVGTFGKILLYAITVSF
jgi:hypothetical protein